MIRRLKFFVFGSLPILVFVPLLIGSRLIGVVSPWVDWTLLLGSASLVAVNPVLQRFESAGTRGATIVAGLALWVVLLFYLSFWVVGTVFSEGL
jgi:hypothetical protein